MCPCLPGTEMVHCGDHGIRGRCRLAAGFSCDRRSEWRWDARPRRQQLQLRRSATRTRRRDICDRYALCRRRVRRSRSRSAISTATKGPTSSRRTSAAPQSRCYSEAEVAHSRPQRVTSLALAPTLLRLVISMATGSQSLVAAGCNSVTVGVLLGSGNGSFAPTTSVSVGSGSYGIAIGDLSGDGKPDLVTANYATSSVSVLLGNGNGSFAGATSIPLVDRPSSVAIGDLNGDGKPDLVTANRDSSTVSVILGNGDGTFAFATSLAVATGPFMVAIGDIDGDGKPDLVTSNAYSIRSLCFSDTETAHLRAPWASQSAMARIRLPSAISMATGSRMQRPRISTTVQWACCLIRRSLRLASLPTDRARPAAQASWAWARTLRRR
mgnify:CR=1 FL=1